MIENKILQEIGRHIPVQGSGIHGKLLSGDHTGFNQLIHQRIDRGHHLQTEGGDQVVVFGGDGDHFVCPEGLAVHYQGLHDLGHDSALFAV